MNKLDHGRRKVEVKVSIDVDGDRCGLVCPFYTVNEDAGDRPEYDHTCLLFNEDIVDRQRCPSCLAVEYL